MKGLRLAKTIWGKKQQNCSIYTFQFHNRNIDQWNKTEKERRTREKEGRKRRREERKEKKREEEEKREENRKRKREKKREGGRQAGVFG